MMKNKYLVIPEHIEDIEKLKKIGIDKFLFPLKFFSVGFNNYYNLKDIIEENSYLLVNRVFDTLSIEKLRTVLSEMPSNIKGIIFEDVGVLNLLKDYSGEKILYNNHFNTNYKSVNALLKYVDSLVVSTDIIKKDLETILEKGKKELCLFGLGHLNISYSNRTLVKNYHDFYNLKYQNNLEIKNLKHKFILNENEFSTVIYDSHIFNGLNEFKKLNNIKYIIINSFNININDLLELIEDRSDILTTTGFLYQKTIYKLRED